MKLYIFEPRNEIYVYIKNMFGCYL